MAKNKLRMGVIGLGMGYGHAKGFYAHPAAELVALCDLDSVRLQTVADELDVMQRYTNATEMFRQAELDAVGIAVPNRLHAPLTIAALGHGLHVLCEKPMACTVNEAKRMQAAADKADKNLMIDFSFRFTPASFALKEQVEAGVIGDIYFGRSAWHRRRGIPGGWFVDKHMAGGGPLLDLGVHRLDLALWLMGYPEPVAVSGSTYDHIAQQEQQNYNVEDLACGLIKFANGATLVLEASWALNIAERERMYTELYGTKGSLSQYNVKGGYEFIGEVFTHEGDSFFNKTLEDRVAPTPSAFTEFIDSIVDQRLPLATGVEGIKLMKILAGIYKSAETGKEVRYKM